MTSLRPEPARAPVRSVHQALRCTPSSTTHRSRRDALLMHTARSTCAADATGQRRGVQHMPGAMTQPFAAHAGGGPTSDTAALASNTWPGQGRTQRPLHLPADGSCDAQAEDKPFTSKPPATAAEAALQALEARERALRPHRIPAPTCGVLGSSAYAQRVRNDLVAAARDPDRGPVAVVGEAGLGKAGLAALVHYGSQDREGSLVQVDCADADGALLRLRGSTPTPGLLDWLQRGDALMLRNADAAPDALQSLILGLMHDDESRAVKCRVLLTSRGGLPWLAKSVKTISVPPLRLRPSDIVDAARHYLREHTQRTGRALVLTPEAELRLEACALPGNAQELEGMIARAVAHATATSCGHDNDAGHTASVAAAGTGSAAAARLQLDEGDFWFATLKEDRFKLNLLGAWPPTRAFLESPLYPTWFNLNLVRPVFALVVALLFLGPQDRAHNLGLSLFWNWWWPAMFVVTPLVGRIWCSVCPFMIYGEWVQRWRTATGAQLLKWPKSLSDENGGVILLAMFGVILVWEEVWDLPDSAQLSGWLLLLITAGAVAASWLFEKRLWCRFLCPIGGMTGLLAKMSAVEVRATPGVCKAHCTSGACSKGGPARTPEGLPVAGCPFKCHPARLTDNRTCVQCMACVKACPHHSPQVRLRIPGIDLWTSHKPSWPEVQLMFMLCGAVMLHHLPELSLQLGMDPDVWTANPDAHVATSWALLAAPGLAAWGMDAAGRACAAAAVSSDAAAPPSPPPFMRLAYGYLPLVWGATLAHYETNLLSEGGQLLPLAALTLGLQPGAGLPSGAAHPAVVALVQGVTMLLGGGSSLVLTRMLGGGSWASAAPQCLGIIALSTELWHLVLH